MQSPLGAWFFFVIGGLIYQIGKIPFGFNPKWGDLADCAYWFGIAMVMVHFGMVAKQ